jgi:putative phosphotransacetylase
MYELTPEQLKQVVEQAVREAIRPRMLVPVGISARHIHLTAEDLARLFGHGYELTVKKQLSQPGQFAAEETLDIIGPKGCLKHVRILGPLRSRTQIEVSQSDLRTLGMTAPVRSSGDTDGTPGVTLEGPCGRITTSDGVIIADRHVHLSLHEAEEFHLRDGDYVTVRIDGVKSGTMEHVLVRASEKFRKDFHIDTDDANAFLLKQGQLVEILGAEEEQLSGRSWRIKT